ncbi:hypothetical protein ARMGADRAFT_692579 [Armillaria gallica]|uniref:Uncharacterized protein n=1 Tax=Armillaria gallica TaxID=47427 RepID=A0A2H3DMA7_ARMGA|nr:hypothetical protein ARMGADRAFT_692579 [Armillaria gallica]
MSSVALPPIRGRCVEHTGNAFCLCSRFTAHRDQSQWHTLDQPRCICGHGIHAHVDYLSLVVHHCPTNYCVAFVQKTPQTQECTCGALLIDHVPVVNGYRSLPAAVTNSQEPFVGEGRSIGSSYSTNASASNDANPILFAPTPSPNTNTLSHIQPGYTQADAEIFIAHHPQGYAPDGDASNGPFFYYPTDAYNAIPEGEAWAGPYA